MPSSLPAAVSAGYITLTPVDGYLGVPNFQGTLDGNHRTVTLSHENLNITTNQRASFGGLICSAQNTLIKDLTLAGTVSGTYTANSGLQDIGF